MATNTGNTAVTAEAHSSPSTPYIRSRIANACDACKARKVKCDGNLPCSYCARRQRAHACHYSPQKRRHQHQQQHQQHERSLGVERRHRDVGGAATGADQRAEAEVSELGSSYGGGMRTRTRTRTATRGTRAVMSRSPLLSPDMGSRQASSRSMRAVTPTTPAVTATPTASSNHHPQPPPLTTADDAAAAAAAAQGAPPSNASPAAAAEDDTDVPREARLLCDAQGKLIFIGDCAPLSFFQSVRQLVTSKVGQNAFAPQTSRFSVLENAPPATRHTGAGRMSAAAATTPLLAVSALDVGPAVSAYLAATSGLVDLFDDAKLLDDLLLWANLDHRPDDVTSIIHYLVLAIGRQMYDEDQAQAYFEHARDRAYTHLSGDLSVGTVQAFVLITIYMLCSCQINGAFLFFGISVRAAYSIGIHRTEVNARFGPDVHRQRDRLWKSLRVVDLFLSTSMGRPPATSDVDCTVPYRSIVDADASGGGSGGGGHELFDLLNVSAQILLIVERVVVEIYSRRKISLQLTEGISHQLREWSARWLKQLKDVIVGGAAPAAAHSEAHMSGACQALASYYYAVMLVSRPFLMYELVRRLSDGQSTAAPRQGLTSGKSKLADACIDAASLMVEPVLDLIDRGCLRGRQPLLVSWLFASSLVLGVGLLGGFGRVLEKYTRMSIQALDHFAKSDTHAQQYSLIAQCLLTAALEHLERREMQERLRRTENSSQLFGLIPHETRRLRGTHQSSPTTNGYHYAGGGGVGSNDVISQAPSPSVVGAGPGFGWGRDAAAASADRSFLQHQGLMQDVGVVGSPRLGDIDSAFLGLSESMMQTPDANYWSSALGNEADSGSALNLFPLLDAGGGIDLAHYL